MILRGGEAMEILPNTARQRVNAGLDGSRLGGKKTLVGQTVRRRVDSTRKEQEAGVGASATNAPLLKWTSGLNVLSDVTVRKHASQPGPVNWLVD